MEETRIPIQVQRGRKSSTRAVYYSPSCCLGVRQAEEVVDGGMECTGKQMASSVSPKLFSPLSARGGVVGWVSSQWKRHGTYTLQGGGLEWILVLIHSEEALPQRGKNGLVVCSVSFFCLAWLPFLALGHLALSCQEVALSLSSQRVSCVVSQPCSHSLFWETS